MITGRNQEALAAAAEAVGRQGGACETFCGDLTQADAIEQCVAAIAVRYGGLDMVVANIGLGGVPTGWNAGEDAWTTALEINLMSAVRLARATGPLLEAARGSFVATSSIAGLEAIPAPAAYVAAKSALTAWVKAASRELGAAGVRVNAVAPGNVLFPGGTWDRKLQADGDRIRRYVEDQVPLRRFGTPEEIADVVGFPAVAPCVVRHGGLLGGRRRADARILRGFMIPSPFDLSGRVAVVTGGAGMLGVKHAEAILAAGGTAVLADIDAARAVERAAALNGDGPERAIGLGVDITQPAAVQALLDTVLERTGRLDILINNAANDPKVGAAGAGPHWSRFETLSLDHWTRDLAVGLTGAFLCSQVLGTYMAARKRGVILNIASDLSVIAPDQRLYRRPGLPEEQQPVKPVTYSVVKTGLVGLTRYLATYWAGSGVRVNALSPGGVYAGQDEGFVERVSSLIPMGRMAGADEYQGAVLFLVSDASSYMTGANLVVDGGRFDVVGRPAGCIAGPERALTSGSRSCRIR